MACGAHAVEAFDLLRGQRVLAGAEQPASGKVVEHQRPGLDPDTGDQHVDEVTVSPDPRWSAGRAHGVKIGAGALVAS
jgi:hypothetical protein